MPPAPFCSHAPETDEEAVAIGAEGVPGNGRILAGGRSPVPAMARGRSRLGLRVDINNVAAIDDLGR